MSAETLRRAAALMRKRALAATPGPWLLDRDERTVRHGYAGEIIWDDSSHHATRGLVDGEHVASWPPEVAMFAAEWLDQAADWREAHPDDVADDPDLTEVNDPALVFARAYLGEES